MIVGIIALMAFIIIVAIFVFGRKERGTGYAVEIEIWGVFDDSDAYNEAIRTYREINPFAGDVRYRKFTIDSYKKDLLSALAAGNGPDIFMINNAWLPEFQDKIVPAGVFLQEKELRDVFVDVVAQDFLDPETKDIYGVPLSVDSLALYYNKDFFNAAGITTPPYTWDEFNAMVRTLTKIDQFGKITQAGTALGTAYNINRSTDLLTLFMLQSGVAMTDDSRKEATFDRPVSTDAGQSPQNGEDVLSFYTQFARASSPVYTWNPSQHYSIDAFFQGEAATMINYSWHYDTIKLKNSKLNFAVAPVPQLTNSAPVNYANYWGFVVAKNKSAETPRQGEQVVSNELRIHEAWQFLRYLTLPHNGTITITNGISGTQKQIPLAIDPAETYLIQTKKPAARRDLVEKQSTDSFLAPFATGNLIAKSWYQVDASAIETILAEMIDDVNRGKATSAEALRLASNRVSQLMQE